MKHKSWKREVAAVLLGFWLLAAGHVFFGVPAADIPAYTALLTNITPFTVIPALAVFGVHDWLQRTKPREETH